MDIKENLTKFTEKFQVTFNLLLYLKQELLKKWKRPMNLVLENLVKIRFKK